MRRVEVRDLLRAVVVEAADQDIGLRCELPDPFDAGIRNAVPCFDIGLIGDLIEQLKCDVFGVIAVSAGKFLPELIELLLIALTVKEAFLGLALVKGEACRLVQIEDQVQVILFAEHRGIMQAVKAGIEKAAVRGLKDIIIHRDAYMVKAPCSDLRKIRLRDPCIERMLCVVAL